MTKSTNTTTDETNLQQQVLECLEKLELVLANQAKLETILLTHVSSASGVIDLFRDMPKA